MKETRFSVSENPMSSICLAITQCSLHSGVSPSYYVGVSKESWSKETLNSSTAEDCTLHFFEPLVYTKTGV